MSEQQDPIRTLESFDTGGVTVAPLAPSEVRRLGNRRRARRRTTTVLVAAAATAAVLVPLGIALGDGSESGTPPITRTPTPSPTRTTATPPATDISYPGAGVTVTTAADTSKLTGTSPEFRTFIAEQLGAIQGPARCAEIDVQKYSAAGYAIGAVGGCGGYMALWARSADTGSWGEGQATQDVWDCDALTYLDVPTSFAGACGNEAGDFATPGAGGPEPGMSQAQLTALGLTVSGPVPGADPTNCPGVDYGSSVLPDRIAGVYDDQDGLVNVVAKTTMKTAERVGLGTTKGKVLAAYHDGHVDASGNFIVPRPGARSLFITFRNARVARMDWRLAPQHCSGWLQ